MIKLSEVETNIVAETGTERDDTMRRVIRLAHANYYGIGLPRLDESGDYPAEYPHTVEQLQEYSIDDYVGVLIVGWAVAENAGG